MYDVCVETVVETSVKVDRGTTLVEVKVRVKLPGPPRYLVGMIREVDSGSAVTANKDVHNETSELYMRSSPHAEQNARDVGQVKSFGTFVG